MTHFSSSVDSKAPMCVHTVTEAQIKSNFVKELLSNSFNLKLTIANAKPELSLLSRWQDAGTQEFRGSLNNGTAKTRLLKLRFF